MRIWIDLSNSPHPLLFAPVARRLGEHGHAVVVTARDNAQTVELGRKRWPELTVIGGTSPKGRVAKARQMADRVSALARWAADAEPDVALSHNSYGQILAARRLAIPAVTAMDFEHQPANHLAFRLARLVLLPAALERSRVRRQGARNGKTRFYPGLKEELYLADFEPDADVLATVGLSPAPEELLVVARPEPDHAAYHSFQNPLFIECLRVVLRNPRVRVVVLPRRDDQRAALERLGLPRCVVAGRAVDSRSLLSQADLMIGAGGTMTREAALMGVPTVSLFAGRRPAVDRWLEEQGSMRVVTDVRDLPVVEHRPRSERLELLRDRGDRLVELFCDAVTAEAGSPVR
jgi:predicted glycosyltransferase